MVDWLLAEVDWRWSTLLLVVTIGPTNSGSRFSSGGLLTIEDFALLTFEKLHVYIIIIYINIGMNRYEEGLK